MNQDESPTGDWHGAMGSTTAGSIGGRSAGKQLNAMLLHLAAIQLNAVPL
jgi:hypothetical protein